MSFQLFEKTINFYSFGGRNYQNGVNLFFRQLNLSVRVRSRISIGMVESDFFQGVKQNKDLYLSYRKPMGPHSFMSKLDSLKNTESG